jgi:hypothetical protein
MKQIVKAFTKVFGTFWTRIWKEPDLITSLTESYARTFSQCQDIADSMYKLQNLSELVLVDTFRFAEFSFEDSDLEEVQVKIGQFVLGDGTQLGDSKEDPTVYCVACPYSDILLIKNSPIEDDVVWVRDQDFSISEGKLYLYRDPFQEQFDISIVGDADGNINNKCTMWFMRSEKETDNLKSFFGVHIQAPYDSTPYNRSLLKDSWSLYTDGVTTNHINTLLSRLVDTDVAAADGVVTDLWTENSRSYIATAANLYSAPNTATPVVAVGDSIVKGQLLYDNLQIFTPSDPIAYTDIPAMALSSGMVAASYAGLVFENIDTELDWTYATSDPEMEVVYDPTLDSILIRSTTTGEYSLIPADADRDDAGVVQLPTFSVKGPTDKVKSFKWSMAGNIFRNNIDLWSYLTQGQNHPYTINPFQFLRDDTFRNNMLFIKVNGDHLVTGAPVSTSIEQLVNTLPTGTSFLIFLQKSATVEEAPLFGEDPPASFHVGDGYEGPLEPVDKDIINAAGKIF